MRFRDLRFPGDTELTIEAGGAARRARLVNVSVTGAKLAGIGRLPRDSMVTLAHLNARHPARVVWSSETQTGLRFVQPLKAAELGAIRREGGRRPGGWAPPAGAHKLREIT